MKNEESLSFINLHSKKTMVEIQDTLVSLDIFKEMFCCDYKVCRGACCVEGDAGAPVDMEEVAGLEEAAEAVWDELTPGAQEVRHKYCERQGLRVCRERRRRQHALCH